MLKHSSMARYYSNANQLKQQKKATVRPLTNSKSETEMNVASYRLSYIQTTYRHIPSDQELCSNHTHFTGVFSAGFIK